MFYEFALDPAVLSTWQRARYFLDAFGPWKGRFISRFPKTWKRLVYDSLAACPDVEKKRIVVRLAAVRDESFVSRVDGKYVGGKPWLENALLEHRNRAFRAIITTNPTVDDFVLDAETLDETAPLWCVESGRQVARDPMAVASALSPLLLASNRLAIIDPYFRADHGDKGDAVRALCEVVRGRDVKIEIQCGTVALSYGELARIGRRALPSVLPTGTTALLVILDAEQGPRFHNRYVLTERGGVQLGDGIERGAPGDQDRLSILGAEEHALLWAQLCGPDRVFKCAGESIEVTGQ